MAAKEFIVAIELGSSKMTGIAGTKNLDGSINVLAVVRKTPRRLFTREWYIILTEQRSACLMS